MAEEADFMADFMSSGGKIALSKFTADFHGPTLIRILEIGKDNGYSVPEEIVPHAIFFVADKIKQKRVSLRTKDGRLLSISLDSPKKFNVVFRFAVGPPITLQQIFKLGFRGSGGDVTVAMDYDPSDNAELLGYSIDYRELKIVSTTEESFLIGHAVTELTMESRVTPLSCRTEMTLEIIDRHATKSSDQFRQWLDSLSQRSSQLQQEREAADPTASSIPDLVLLTDNFTDSKFPCFANSAESSVARAKKLSPEKSNYRKFTKLSEMDKTEDQSGSKTMEVRKLRACIETEIEYPGSKSAPLAIYKEKLMRCLEVTRAETRKKTLGFDDVRPISLLQNLSVSDENFGRDRPRRTTDPGELNEYGGKVTQVRLKTGRSLGMSVRSPIRRCGELGKAVESKKEIPRSKSHDDLIEVSKTRRHVGIKARLRARIIQSFREKTFSLRRPRLERSEPQKIEFFSSDDDDDDEDGDDYEKVIEPPMEEIVRKLNTVRMALTDRRTFLAESFFNKRTNFPRIPKPCPPVPPRPTHPETPKVKDETESLVVKNRQVRHDYLEIIMSSDPDDDVDCTTTRATLVDEPGFPRTSLCSDSSTAWKGASKEKRRLAKDSAEIPVDLDVAALTVREVGHCLRLLNMSGYVKKFKRRVVDGAILVTMTERMLVESFGMDRLDARKIVMFSRNNWRPCLH